MDSHFLRTSIRPIPPVEQHTEYVEAGPLTVGIEYRVLADDISGANKLPRPSEPKTGRPASAIRDRGVTLHVFQRKGDKLAEYLRFDCFDESPHYHYVQASGEYQEIYQLDPVADGDPLAWALERLRTRLPQMLEKIGAGDLVKAMNQQEIDEALPKIAEAAYRARFESNEEEIHRGAVAV